MSNESIFGRFSGPALFFSSAVFCFPAFGAVEGGGAVSRAHLLWATLAVSVVIEYVLVCNVFKVRLRKDALVMASLTLFTSGALYLVVLLLANIILALAGLTASFGVNVMAGCLAMSAGKVIIYMAMFKLPMSTVRFIGVLISSTLTALLLSSISYVA